VIACRALEFAVTEIASPTNTAADHLKAFARGG
jgi:hypothetical protein